MYATEIILIYLAEISIKFDLLLKLYYQIFDHFKFIFISVLWKLELLML